MSAQDQPTTRVWHDRGANGWRTYVSEPLPNGGFAEESEIFVHRREALQYVADFWLDWNSKQMRRASDVMPEIESPAETDHRQDNREYCERGHADCPGGCGS